MASRGQNLDSFRLIDSFEKRYGEAMMELTDD